MVRISAQMPGGHVEGVFPRHHGGRDRAQRHGVRSARCSPVTAAGSRVIFQAGDDEPRGDSAGRRVRTRCPSLLRDQADACLVIDEIQTGFWFPRCFLYHEYGNPARHPDRRQGDDRRASSPFVLVYRRKYDRLEQYDTISTNGNAPLAALAGLGCMVLHCGRSQTDRQHEPPLFDPALRNSPRPIRSAWRGSAAGDFWPGSSSTTSPTHSISTAACWRGACGPASMPTTPDTARC